MFPWIFKSRDGSPGIQPLQHQRMGSLMGSENNSASRDCSRLPRSVGIDLPNLHCPVPQLANPCILTCPATLSNASEYNNPGGAESVDVVRQGSRPLAEAIFRRALTSAGITASIPKHPAPLHSAAVSIRKSLASQRGAFRQAGETNFSGHCKHELSSVDRNPFRFRIPRVPVVYFARGCTGY